MATFIREVLIDIQQKGLDPSQLSFVFPNKRAGLFLKHEWIALSQKTGFAPEIYSIEEFIEELSGLRQISRTKLLFEFYQVYKSVMNEDQTESFDNYLKWAAVLLNDFNELDQYLIDTDHLFSYLTAIDNLEHWSKSSQPTDITKSYLEFRKHFKALYSKLYDRLLNSNLAYNGMIYREAVNSLEAFIQNCGERRFVFLGFNALNRAESRILQELIQLNLANVYWDAHKDFINNPHHNAGYFMRTYIQDWQQYENEPFQWIHDDSGLNKEIDVIQIQKQIGQAKMIGEILEKKIKDGGSLNSTAIILGDEAMLVPLLNSLPPNVGQMNITMGIALRQVLLAALFQSFFILHRKKSTRFYYKEVLEILSHPFVAKFITADSNSPVAEVMNIIKERNITFLGKEKIKTLMKGSNVELIDLLFSETNGDPQELLNRCQDLIKIMKSHLVAEESPNLIWLEQLYAFNKLFIQVSELFNEYDDVKTIDSLYELYKQLLLQETLDFKGEPLSGLQIMGMLESRVIDFDHVIISSVNEGILPAGGMNSSFIPFDLKLEYGLPTYNEKDSVYAYHFYRLLHRADQITLLYNSDPDFVKGGEKSRFIKQLEISNRDLNHIIVNPKLPQPDPGLAQITKTPDVMHIIEERAKNGFSPSALLLYIRNPIDFYKRYVLGIKDPDEMEEEITPSTLGTIVHESMRELYEPFMGRFLKSDELKSVLKQLEPTVEKYFNQFFKEGEIQSGKNLIIFEVAKQFIRNFIAKEIEQLKSGAEIEILGLEMNIDCSLVTEGRSKPVKLIGQIDRVDRFNGVIRIIDYKTGRVELNQLEIVNWEDITSDYAKFNKSFQLLTYAYMFNQNRPEIKDFESGIYSFKNMKGGFLRFSKKDRSGVGAKKESQLNSKVLSSFKMELDQLISEICDPELDFIEKQEQ